MLIDWFTVGAQVVNFLILVALLKHFLYGRIVKAMDDRKARLAAQASEAEEKREKAAAEAEEYERKNQEFEKERESLLAEAREKAGERRDEMLKEAEREVEGKRRHWHDALEREKADFLSALRQKTAREVGKIARRALEDLGNARLEISAAGAFAAKLRDIEDDDWEALRESVEQQEDGRIVIRSGFELPEDSRQEIEQVIRDRLADAVFEYETGSSDGWGLELRTGDRKIGWGLDDYLGGLEEAFSEELQQPMKKTNGQESETAREDEQEEVESGKHE